MSQEPPKAPLDGWKLIWSDEFTGNALDQSKWVYDIGGGGWGNSELQNYTVSPNNSKVENGILSIIARKENYQGNQYTSARLTTKGKFSFTYGRVDVSAKLPTGQGYWPAIWSLPDENSWPVTGELDLMEAVGGEPMQVFGSLNYGDPFPGNKWVNGYYRFPNNGNFGDGYHTYSIEWEPNKIRWYVDGNLYSTKTPADLGNCQNGPCRWPFDKPIHLLLNVAVGGTLGGWVAGTTKFPQSMDVQFVRVYQKGTTPTPPVPTPPVPTPPVPTPPVPTPPVPTPPVPTPPVPPTSGPEITTQLLTQWPSNGKTMYNVQVVINNTTGKKIKNVIFPLPSGIQNTWNTVITQNTLALPTYIQQYPIFQGATFRFGGIFDNMPNFTPISIVYE